jgi:Protein of unknown function (DUF1553)/Protein of unknown function (DUF1549)/Planctomycete cytochrome C
MRFALLLSALAVVGATRAADPPVDFNRDIRPILSDRCFKCHGPATQKAKVRLDSLDHAKKTNAIVPGKPDESAILDRILAERDDERMPPPEAGARLTDAQVKTLKAWIAAGAKYEPHWAFTSPVRVNPDRQGGGGTNHPIDGFVYSRLEKEGIKPSPQADKATLIRRASLDLIGLLPTPAEVDAFMKDDSANAYEKLVDRLLASPHYGERQARHWLDLARYADSNGFTVDGARSIWPYRDWVIAALNKDMPFDQFTIDQLAGDMLPNPTKDQLVATGFHRNTAFNEEGGADPEQFRVERVIDRTNTTAAVWLGLTFQCAQCHDHKYDPVSQKDYYSLYAFFNSCDEVSTPVGGSAELEKKVNELMAKSEELKAAGKLDDGKKVDMEIKRVQGRTPTTLILRERKQPRENFVQIRGDFLRKGDPVTPSYPASIGKAQSSKLTRLDLAKWLVSADNPLTARVVVNRAWQQFFGKGLVETENDFGMQGALPTHPDLLDWLAVEFREKGWSLKKLHRLVVTSATYKQASFARPDLKDKDPQNKLIARQNRLRLEAEIIRDAALSASGLLAKKVGGPGVYPPLPKEVFSFTQSNHPWIESKGEDRYRRGMYTFLWRQSQHHLLTTFDAADAQVACTRRNRSNTPLQALHLANDPAFVEFFDALGKRVLKDGPKDDTGRIDLVFKLCFCRPPSEAERERVLKYVSATDGEDVKRWAAVARVLMNLDEFVTRE